MTGEFEPNDSRNVTGTASTPDGHWTGQDGQTPGAAGQQQQGGGDQSANAQSQNAPGSSGGMSGGSSGGSSGGMSGEQQDGGSFSGADQSQSGMDQAGSGGQQSQYGSSSGQMGGEGGQSDMVSQVREDMTVVGPDGETVGRIDKVEGGQIKLTRHDSADGQHHYLDASQIEMVEGDEVRLSQTPDWISGNSSRPM